jgi:cleavage and polyadenylation specificity factor subunit 1
LSEEFAEVVDLDLELVTTAGFGKNGALCVLQKSIRPQIVTTFTLPGCSNMWTVHAGEEKHAFLILSQEDGTMVCILSRKKFFFGNIIVKGITNW